MAQYVNLKKYRNSIFKKKDKTYLLRKNIKAIKLSNKLEYTKLRLYRIKKVLGLVNYKLDLSKKIKIYLSFYILVLKPANPETLI